MSHRFINYKLLSGRKKPPQDLEMLVQQLASLVLIINAQNPAQTTGTRASRSRGQAAEQPTQYSPTHFTTSS